MTDELKFPDPGERRGAREEGTLDERTARSIRAVYRPPVASGEAEYAYWDSIERRIMARVSAGQAQYEPGWMSVLGSWAQIGLVAAAALFATAGLVSTRFADSEEMAYESLVNSTPDALSAPAQLMTSSDQSVQRDAALQYVLSY